MMNTWLKINPLKDRLLYGDEHLKDFNDQRSPVVPTINTWSTLSRLNVKDYHWMTDIWLSMVQIHFLPIIFYFKFGIFRIVKMMERCEQTDIWSPTVNCEPDMFTKPRNIMWFCLYMKPRQKLWIFSKMKS